jgi:signal transduction histidine kinase
MEIYPLSNNMSEVLAEPADRVAGGERIMDVGQRDPEERPPAEAADLAELLRPGVLVVGGGGVTFADAWALGLLGCADRAAAEKLWQGGLRDRLQSAGRATGVETVEMADGRRLSCDWRADGDGGVLLVSDAAVGESLTADLRSAVLLRSLAHITPAVAHDLRAPINAMVFNIEILKETIAAGKGAEPAGRDRQLRYVGVLRDELHRLHQGLETYIAQISPRGDRDETFDLREPLGELAALLVGPARKQQARVSPELPGEPVTVAGNRFHLRQALLHVAVAALAGVPRDGALEIRLEPRGGTALVRISAQGGTGTAAAQGAPRLGLAASPRGTQAQIWTACSILSTLGSAVRCPEAPGAPLVYEVELTMAETGSQEKE